MLTAEETQMAAVVANAVSGGVLTILSLRLVPILQKLNGIVKEQDRLRDRQEHHEGLPGHPVSIERIGQIKERIDRAGL